MHARTLRLSLSCHDDQSCVLLFVFWVKQVKKPFLGVMFQIGELMI